MNRKLRFARLSNDPLPRNGAHGLAAKHALAIYGLNAVYSFIPKNACSTMRYSIAIHNGFLREGDDPAWIIKNNGTFTADQRMLVECTHSFVILRCPYRRLASAFLDKIVRGDDTGKLLLTKSGSPEDLAAVTAADIQRLAFRDFARLCMQPPSGLVDFHWYPQSNFLVYEDYDAWFCVEQFAAASQRLAEIGLTVRDTRKLIDHSTYQYEAVEGDFSDVPAYQIEQMKLDGKVPSYASLYDDQSRTYVQQYYAADIALFREKFGAEALLFND